MTGWKRSHCIRGNEWTPENASVDSRGKRTCRACRRAWELRNVEQLRAAARPARPRPRVLCARRLLRGTPGLEGVAIEQHSERRRRAFASSSSEPQVVVGLHRKTVRSRRRSASFRPSAQRSARGNARGNGQGVR
jgi:hypothetical protein